MWKDITSYSRGQSDRILTSYEAKVGTTRVCITKGHIHYKGEWLLRCHDLGIEKVIGIAENITDEEAQKLAIKVCIDRLKAYLKAFNNVK